MKNNNVQPYIIAEIGFNHGGDMGCAREMIAAVARAGANAVKFQSFRASDIALPDSRHYSDIVSAEISDKNHALLAQCATEYNLDFLSTPFSLQAVEMLDRLGVPAFKVASMDCTNTLLLKCIAATGKPVYLSTGMSSESEVRLSLSILRDYGAGEVTLLHCVSKYPAEIEDLNLSLIPWMRKSFGVPVGYSDHYPGIDACLMAAALGASIIETHFTLDTSMEGSDHGHSADETGLTELVNKAAIFSSMRGTPDLSERADKKFRLIFRRGVYARRDLSKGERLTLEKVFMCRPVKDLGPEDLESVMGHELNCDVPAHTPIRNDMFHSHG